MGLRYQVRDGRAALETERVVLVFDGLTPVQQQLFHFEGKQQAIQIGGNGTSSVCEATVKVRVGDQSSHTVAEGDGPVNALDGALRLGLARFFPKLRKVTLTDYKVRILDGVAGTAARTRVLIASTDGHEEWGTVGVSENIITASLQALVDSIEYALFRR